MSDSGWGEEEDSPPIAELQDLRDDVPEDFHGRVRNAIHRRILTVDLVDLTWFAPFAVLMESLRVFFEHLTHGDDERG